MTKPRAFFIKTDQRRPRSIERGRGDATSDQPGRIKRQRWGSLAPILGLLVLVGCGPKVDVAALGDVTAARQSLEAALVDGPVRAQIFGDPYGMDPARQERLVTSAFGEGVQGIKARFTADPGLYAAAQPRLVVVLNPRSDPPSSEACRAPERIRTGSAFDELAVLAVFCEGDQVVDGARAEGEISGPSDQRLKRMLWQTAGALFPDNYENDYGVDLIPGVNIGIGGSFGF